MKDFIISIVCILFGFCIGGCMAWVLCDEAHTKPMDALGIEKFQKCEINTTNCHSNWYEIVWRNNGK